MRIDAIGYGAAAGLAVALLSITLGFVVPYETHPEWIPRIVAVNRALGFLSYVLAGVVAGCVATSRGALHGGLAAFVSGLLGRIVGIGVSGWRYGAEALQAMLASWPANLGWLVFGTVLGAVAGMLAAAMRRRTPQ